MMPPDHSKPQRPENRQEPTHTPSWDPSPTASCERAARLAARMFGARVVHVSVRTERHGWYQTGVGLPTQGTTPDVPLGLRVLEDEHALIISDVEERPNVRALLDHAGLPGVRFFAGVSILNTRGEIAGSLCVMDHAPRDADKVDAEALHDLAVLIASDVETRLTFRRQQYEASLLHAIRDVVVGVDGHLRITFINEAGKQLYGVSDAVLGRSLREAFTYRWLSEHDQRHAIECLTRREPWAGEGTHVLRDGRELHVSLRLIPTIGPDGRTTGALITVHDLTERIRREQLEHDRRRIFEMIAEGAELREVLHETLATLERHLPGMNAMVLRVREGRLYEAIPSRLPHAYRAMMDGFPVGPHEGTSGVAVHTGEITITPDVREDPNWVKYADDAVRSGVVCCWSAPIRSRANTVLGSFEMCGGTPRTPSEEDLRILQDAARVTAVIIERYEALDAMRHQALHDALTGLPNRSLFDELLQQVLSTAERQQNKVAVGLIDLDNFKGVNDTLGHAVGDELLCQVARRLQQALRADSTAGRMGGDEFALIIPAVHGDRDVEAVAKRISSALTEPFHIAGQEMFVRASIGFVTYPDDAKDPGVLLSLADVAMYRAKRQRSQWVLFNQQHERPSVQAFALEHALHRALERGELSLHYQPVISARTGRVRGLEALLRWTHPEFGSISPATFIPMAENTGLIVPIGEWVIREACHAVGHFRSWQDDLTMYVNLSAKQFANPNLTTVIMDSLNAANLPPNVLEVEITESALMNAVHAEETIRSLRDLGVCIAIDDFGTGYSNLQYLMRFPVHTLKVDRSFVHGIDGEPDSAKKALVHTIIQLARALKLRVVAEGVETAMQAEFLKTEQCDALQGWLYARAMPPEELARWFAERQN